MTARLLGMGPATQYCKTCGGLGDGGGTMPECANCWEVEGRIDRYLRSERGAAFVAQALAKYLATKAVYK